MLKKSLTYLQLLCLSSISVFAQTDVYHASVDIQGTLTSKDHVPFWMRSDRFGNVPLPGPSVSLIGAVSKTYSSNAGLTDWGGALEVRGDAGDQGKLTIIEGYVKARFSIFQLKAGRMKDFSGLVDSTLSSGAFAISGNAPGIPKIQASIPEFFAIPVFGRLFSFKGNFDYGWIGHDSVQWTEHTNKTELYYHQLSFWGRLGKPNWRLQLYGGFTHQVIWGDERAVYGPQWTLSPFKTFEYAVTGKTYKGSKVGNHLGSIDLGVGYDFGDVNVYLYRQNFYDEGALAKLANIKDGLNGIAITNKRFVQDVEVPDYYPVQGYTESGFRWHKVVLELFYSKDQAGYPWSKPTNSGDENYYNNFEYFHGWGYKGYGLGNPFITPAYTTRSGFPNSRGDYFNNNRVMAFYGAIDGAWGEYNFTARGSYSFNYGTFGTSPWGHTTGSPANYTPVPKYNWFPEVKQFSAYLDVYRRLDNGWQAGGTLAFDKGHLFNDSYGLILSVKKIF